MDPRQFVDILDEMNRAVSGNGRAESAPKQPRYQRAFVVTPDHEGRDAATSAIDMVYADDPAAGDDRLEVLQSLHDWVVDELRLSPAMSAADLHAARRRFALAHHPDRVDAVERERATQRMTLANMLIDQALMRTAG